MATLHTFSAPRLPLRARGATREDGENLGNHMGDWEGVQGPSSWIKQRTINTWICHTKHNYTTTIYTVTHSKERLNSENKIKFHCFFNSHFVEESFCSLSLCSSFPGTQTLISRCMALGGSWKLKTFHSSFSLKKGINTFSKLDSKMWKMRIISEIFSKTHRQHDNIERVESLCQVANDTS